MIGPPQSFNYHNQELSDGIVIIFWGHDPQELPRSKNVNLYNFK